MENEEFIRIINTVTEKLDEFIKSINEATESTKKLSKLLDEKNITNIILPQTNESVDSNEFKFCCNCKHRFIGDEWTCPIHGSISLKAQTEDANANYLYDFIYQSSF